MERCCRTQKTLHDRFFWTASRAKSSTDVAIEVGSLSGPWGKGNYDDFAEFDDDVRP